MIFQLKEEVAQFQSANPVCYFPQYSAMIVIDENRESPRISHDCITEAYCLNEIIARKCLGSGHSNSSFLTSQGDELHRVFIDISRERAAKIITEAEAMVTRTRDLIILIITNKSAEENKIRHPREAAISEAQDLVNYINGDVYGWVIIESHSNEIEDSCWGYYDLDYCREECLAAFNFLKQSDEKKSEQGDKPKSEDQQEIKE